MACLKTNVCYFLDLVKAAFNHSKIYLKLIEVAFRNHAMHKIVMK